MTNYRAIFRNVVLIVFLVTNFFSIPGIIYPITVAEKLGAATPAEGVWAAFGFLLSFLVSLFSIPVIIDVQRYKFNAVVGVAAHFILFLYWFVLYPLQTAESIPWIAWFELLAALLEALLIPGALKEALENPG